MKNVFILLFVLCFCQNVIGQDSTSTVQLDTIKGKVIDLDTKEPLIFATVALYKSGHETPITGIETDLDGNYEFVIDEGTYDLQVSYAGYLSVKKTKIEVNQLTFANFEMSPSSEGTVIELYCPTIPILRMDKTTSGRTYTARDIENMPVKW